MKIIYILILLFTSQIFARDQKYLYSESADVFEIMDQLSRWHPAINDVIEKEWKLKFGEHFNNKNYIEDYINLRKKYYKYPIQTTDTKTVFSKFSIANNYFSNTFYSSSSIGEALNKLKKHLNKREVKFLANFYTHFKDKITVFVKESTFFKSKTKSYIKKMKKLKAKSIIRNARRFILQKKSIKNQKVLFSWWPKDQGYKIDIRGKHIIVRVHPENTTSYPKPKELIKYKIRTFFANLSSNEKNNINSIFLKKCAPKGVDGAELLELPLSIVFSEMLIEEKKLKREFNYHKNWSVNPWINLYAKLLFPELKLALKRKDNLLGEFILNATSLCHDVMTLNDFSSSFKNN